MIRSLTYITTGLETGGAEVMLLNLLMETDRARWRPAVVSLRDRGTLGGEIEQLGVPVAALGLGAGIPNPRAAWRAWRALKTQAPDLLVGWMYHGNLGALLSRWAIARRIPVLWNIRYTPDDLGLEKRSTALTIRVGARFSGRATRIIYNSRVSAERHQQLGYVPSRAVVIPNGIDTARFAPSLAARAAWRARLGVSAETVVIGRIGRYHSMKDYPCFLGAASRLRRERPSVHFVLAGKGVDSGNSEMMGLIATLGLTDAVSLLGEVRPTQELTAALDVACSSSAYGEAFPSILGEAMACGVPCVATDVGDSSWILGSTGKVVPPRDQQALAAAFRDLVDVGPAQRSYLGAQGRTRVRDHFSIRQVVGMYESLFAEVTV